MLMFNTWNLHNFMQNYIAIMTTNKLKCNLMYVTSKRHKFKTNIICIKFILFYSNPMNFAWTYCLMNFSWILLKFHNIGCLWWICNLKITFKTFILNYKYLDLSWDVKNFTILDWWICNLKITLNFFIMNHKYLDLSWDVKNFTILDVFDEYATWK